MNNAIHCNNCKARIEAALINESGVLSVTADYTTQKVQLYFNEDELTLLRIKQVLEEIGFPAE